VTVREKIPEIPIDTPVRVVEEKDGFVCTSLVKDRHLDVTIFFLFFKFTLETRVSITTHPVRRMRIVSYRPLLIIIIIIIITITTKSAGTGKTKRARRSSVCPRRRRRRRRVRWALWTTAINHINHNARVRLALSDRQTAIPGSVRLPPVFRRRSLRGPHNLVPYDRHRGVYIILGGSVARARLKIDKSRRRQ